MPIMMARDFAEITTIRTDMRADRPMSLSLRRGESTLTTQNNVRVARLASGSRNRSESGSEMRGGILVTGATSLNIAVDDRFTYSGRLYRVKFVRPNKDTGTQAECELVE